MQIAVGQWESVVGGNSGLTAVMSMVVADAYYFYDIGTCANGITAGATGACSGASILTSSNTLALQRSDGWVFRATGARVDTPVVANSATQRSVYNFCATPTSSSNAKMTRMCLTFTLLFKPFPTNFFSPATAAFAETAQYTCGTYSTPITLFDVKVRRVSQYLAPPMCAHSFLGACRPT